MKYIISLNSFKNYLPPFPQPLYFYISGMGIMLSFKTKQ